jgi:hypothetical protein
VPAESANHTKCIAVRRRSSERSSDSPRQHRVWGHPHMRGRRSGGHKFFELAQSSGIYQDRERPKRIYEAYLYSRCTCFKDLVLGGLRLADCVVVHWK